jgi:hypothetical protein
MRLLRLLTTVMALSVGLGRPLLRRLLGSKADPLRKGLIRRS